MKRVFFTVVALLFLLCGCGANDSGDLLDVPAHTGPFSVYQRGKNIEIEKNGVLVGMIEDVGYSNAQESKDGSALIVKVNKSGRNYDEPGYDGDSIYYYKDELVLIADRTFGSMISENGESVGYNTYTPGLEFIELLNSECDLCIWRGGETTIVTKQKPTDGYGFSPDGKDFYYEIGTESMSDSGGWYLYNNGNPILIGENVTLTDYSNNSEYFYGYTEDTYFVQKGINGERRVLAELTEEGNFDVNSSFNADYTKLMLNTPEGLFLIENGEPVRIGDTIDMVLVPEPEEDYYYYPDFEDMPGQIVLTESGKLCKIGETYEVIELDEDVTQAYLANDGETVIYIIESIRADQYLDSYIAKLNVNSTADPTILSNLPERLYGTESKELKEFEISNDGKIVFYAVRSQDTNDVNLYVINNDEPILIESGLDRNFNERNGVVYNNDKYYYADEDDKTLYCFDGEKTVEVKKFSSGINWISTSNDRLEVSTLKDDDYYSYDGIEFIRKK